MFYLAVHVAVVEARLFTLAGRIDRRAGRSRRERRSPDARRPCWPSAESRGHGGGARGAALVLALRQPLPAGDRLGLLAALATAVSFADRARPAPDLAGSGRRLASVLRGWRWPWRAPLLRRRPGSEWSGLSDPAARRRPGESPDTRGRSWRRPRRRCRPRRPEGSPSPRRVRRGRRRLRWRRSVGEVLRRGGRRRAQSPGVTFFIGGLSAAGEPLDSPRTGGERPRARATCRRARRPGRAGSRR